MGRNVIGTNQAAYEVKRHEIMSRISDAVVEIHCDVLGEPAVQPEDERVEFLANKLTDMVGVWWDSFHVPADCEIRWWDRFMAWLAQFPPL